MIPFSQLYFSDNKKSKQMRDKFLKQTNYILNDCKEIYLLNNIFFSEENIDIINKGLILSIYKKSNNKYLINHQETEKLYIIMNYVYMNYSKNYKCNIIKQIKILNNIVINLIIDDIISELNQRMYYLNEINKKKELIDLPINTGRTKMLNSIDSIFRA